MAAQAYTVNPGSRTIQGPLAKEAVTLVHGVRKASETEFVTNLRFPVYGGKGFSKAEIVLVRGDQVGKMPSAEMVGEMISKFARWVVVVKWSSAADNIIRGGGMRIG
ncbi:hypothetical protein B9Z19DRAFT_1069727 [Tuber borchii]|uniref:Uncharacterized protein n=1 Tax=Tuber borchii TaxID=42251 RepID=A0A2T6ZAH1_TUBBO|nr:hypothetical protein B9Z19DRAFT_1069727 [Tuber borchii]